MHWRLTALNITLDGLQLPEEGCTSLQAVLLLHHLICGLKWRRHLPRCSTSSMEAFPFAHSLPNEELHMVA